MSDLKELAFTNRWYVTSRWGNPDAHPFALEAADDLVNAIVGAGPVETPDAELPDSGNVTEGGPKARVALVVGHNARAKGAYVKGALNEFEYDFNNTVADFMLYRAWDGLELKRFNRIYSGSYYSEIKEVYGRVNAWKPELTVEMHFNGGGGDYSFMLHHHASETSKLAAIAMNRVFVDALGFRDKGNRPLYSGDRGYQSMAKAASPSVLTEPFFGDNPKHASKISALGHERFAELYLLAIREALGVIG